MCDEQQTINTCSHTKATLVRLNDKNCWWNYWIKTLQKMRKSTTREKITRISEQWKIQSHYAGISVHSSDYLSAFWPQRTAAVKFCNTNKSSLHAHHNLRRVISGFCVNDFLRSTHNEKSDSSGRVIQWNQSYWTKAFVWLETFFIRRKLVD